jgi:hypothetical protein
MCEANASAIEIRKLIACAGIGGYNFRGSWMFISTGMCNGAKA